MADLVTLMVNNRYWDCLCSLFDLFSKYDNETNFSYIRVNRQ